MAKKANTFHNPLLEALRFISVAQRANGTDAQRYCMLNMHSAVAFDGLIAAGVRIEENLQCCPQTDRLIAALESCVAGYTVSHVAQDQLNVTSNQFVANIRLANPADMQWAMPDPQTCRVDDKLKAALMSVVSIVDDKADKVHESSILLQPYTCLSTNGNLVLEALHGWDLPPQVLLPKRCVAALVKAGKPLVGLGYGATSVTFHFQDSSWIRSQRFLSTWPATDLLKQQTNPGPIPPGLFVVANQLAPFSENGQLYFYNGQASSHPFANRSAYSGQVVDVPGIVGSRVYPITALDAIAPFATLYDDTTINKRTFVYGTRTVKVGKTKKQSEDIKIRGCFAHATETADNAPVMEPVGSMGRWAENPGDDDIPF